MPDANYPIPGVAYLSADDSARYRSGGAWLDCSAGDMLRAAARRSPTKWALVSQERRLTYAELDEATERLGAALLELGLAPGDRALFQMGTVIETAIALFGCFKAGLVPVCTLPQHREIEMGELGRRSEATAYFVQSDFSTFDLSGFAVKLAADVATVREIIVARGATSSGTRSLEALIESVSLAAGARATRRRHGRHRRRADLPALGRHHRRAQDHSALSRGVHGLGARLGAPAIYGRKRRPALRSSAHPQRRADREPVPRPGHGGHDRPHAAAWIPGCSASGSSGSG